MAVVVLACLAVPLLLGWFPQAPLRAPAERLAGELLNASVSIGQLRVTPGLLKLRVDRLRVVATGWDLEAETVEVAIHAGVVFGATPSLRKVTVASPRLVWRGGATQPDSSESTPTLRVDELSITDGQIRAADYPGASMVSLNVRGAIGTAEPLEIDGSIVTGGEPAEVDFQATLLATLSGPVTVREARLATNASHLNVSGSLGGLDLSGLDLEFETRVAREDIPAEYRTAGTELAGSGSLRAQADGLELAARFDVGDGAGRFDVAGSWQDDLIDARVELEEVDVQSLARGAAGRTAPDRLSGHVQLKGPTAGPLAVAVELTAGRSRGVRYSLGSALDGSVASDASRVDSEWRVEGEIGSGLAPWLGPLSLGMRGTARGALPPRIDGTLELRTELGGERARVALQVDGELVNQGSRSTLDSTWRTPHGARGRVAVELDGDTPRGLSADFESVLLESWAQGLRGSATGRVELAGTLESLTGGADLGISELGFETFELGAAVATIRVSPGREVGTLSLPALRIDSDLELRDRAILRGELTLRETPLAPLLRAGGLPTEAGSITGRFDFEVPLADPARGRVSGKIEAATWQGQELDAELTAPLGIELVNGVLAFEDLRLRGAGSQLSGSGRIDLAGREIDAVLALDGDLATIGVRDVTGRLAADLTVRGTLDEPLAEGELRVSDLATGSLLPWAVDVDQGTLRLSGHAFELEPTRLSLACGTIRISGRGDLRALRAGSGKAAHVQLDWTDLELADLIPQIDQLSQIRGRVSGSAVVDGGSRDPKTLHGELSVPAFDIGVDGRSIRLEPFDVAIASGVVSTVGIQLAMQKGTARLSGSIDLAGDAHLEVDWQDLQLADILPPNADAPRIEGRISGKAVLDGAPQNPALARAQLSVPAFSLSIDERPLEVGVFSLVLRDGVLSLPDAIRVQSSAGSVSLSGSVDVANETLSLAASGDLEARMLSFLLPTMAISGGARTDVQVSGPWGDPAVSGGLTFSNGAIRLRELPVAIADVNGTLKLGGDQIRLDSLTGTIGGGAVAVSGSARLEGAELDRVELAILGKGVGLEYPPGLRSRLDVDMTLRGQPGALTLAGRADVTSANFDLAAAESTAVAQAESPFLRGILLDIDVTTVAPVRVRHDLARFEAMGRLDIRGDLERPQPFGRFEARTGGRLELSGRDFSLETGSVTYRGSWNPLVNGTASARIVDDISGWTHNTSLSISGTLESPEVNLTSDPPLALGELVTLVATGTTAGSGGNTQAIAAGEQAASLLWSRLSRGASGGLSGFGIDEVTIQPELGLREVRPGARFTFGKRLTPRLRLIYSVSLEGPEARFFELETGPYRGFSGRAQRRDDGSLTLGAGQRVRFGRGTGIEAARERPVRLRSVEFSGELPLAQDVLMAEGRIEPGKLVTRWGLQNAAGRIQDRLVSEGYIEATVGGQLDEDGGVARVSVSAGPRYTWRVDGMQAPPSLDAAILDSLDEVEATTAGRQTLLGTLWQRGYPFATVDPQRDAAPDRVELSFSVTPGRHVPRVVLQFPGARALSRKALLDACGAPHRVLSDPGSCPAGIQEAYRRVHHLRASIGETHVADGDAEVEVTIPIDEGPRAKLLAVTATGGDPAHPDLVDGTRLAPGTPITVADVEAAAARIRERYYALGHPSVRVVPHLRDSEGDYLLDFEVEPGPTASVESIHVSGAEGAPEGLVRSRLTLGPGDPLDPREIARSERKLLETGLFSRVAITATESGARSLDVQLLERPRYTLGYDVRYNDDRGASALAEAEVGNLLGRGLSVGVRGQLASDQREIRSSLSLPLELGGTLTLQGAQLDETFKADFGEEVIENDRRQREIQLRHGMALGDELGLTYGYRFKRVKFVSGLGFESQEDVAALDVALLRDTRDDLLDPRSGSSMVVNLSFAPSLLGATFQYVKGYTRASFARPIGESMTWAQGYSFGLGTGLGDQPIISTERFQAGGANSLRGFGEGGAGPQGPGGDPIGGEALVVINQELRYRHATGLGLGVFYDVGNVFPTVREMIFDVRHTLGAGVRYSSPVGLLRLDLGWLVDAKEDESRTRWHFSIGQAF